MRKTKILSMALFMVMVAIPAVLVSIANPMLSLSLLVVPFLSIALPKGIVKLPFTLTEETPGITLTDSVTLVESEIVEYQIPRNMSVAFKPGSRFALRLQTAAEAEITAGTVRVYVSDANKATKFKVLEAPITALNPNDGTSYWLVSDRDKMHRLAQGFSRGADELLIITFEGTDVADDANTLLILEGVQFIKI